MRSVNYTLRVDENDKQNAEQVFKALGMTFSTGINIYLKTVSRQQRIPFDLALDEPPGEVTVIETTQDEKKQAYEALRGILAGQDVDLDKMREERIMSK